MPLLKIQTNHTIDENTSNSLLTEASKLVSTELGKPENYVMIIIEPLRAMMFAGSTDQLAYIELKSIGLPESKITDLSQALCGLIEDTLGIPTSRIYIEFTDVPRKMWGWNSGTF